MKPLESKRPGRAVDQLESWGRYPRVPARLFRPERMRDFHAGEGPSLARGLGRSYGDAALLTDGDVVLSERLDRCLEFNPETGVLRAEAGLSLDALIRAFVPQGWFVPVTPGTAFCTLGGCVAANVHGKNHHRDGSFRQGVTRLEMLSADGSVRDLTPADGDDFEFAFGGMGLTGMIREVELQLRPITTSMMMVRHSVAGNLPELMAQMDDEARDDHYSVAWVDLLARGERAGRGVLMTGHHAEINEVPMRYAAHPETLLTDRPGRARPFPFEAPTWLLSPGNIRLFNSMYHKWQGRKGTFFTPLRTFFHPLDAIRNWNRMYGKPGFVQYQFVVPFESGREAVTEVISRLNAAQASSFLAVLKRMGASDGGPLSFPMPGYTLALDIPLREGVIDLLNNLDALVADHGGRVYLAKDSALRPDTFRRIYPEWERFVNHKRQVDPEGRWQSDLARRLELV